MTDVKMGARITRWLESSPRYVLVSYAIAVSFAVYFCMYAFRKPFSAAKYEIADGVPVKFWGLDLKTVFALSQIIGYMLSKYIGIRICPEVTRRRRVVYLVALIVVAEIALFLFAAPLSAPSRNIGTSFDFLVRQPAEYTFVRPLGEF